MLRIIYHFSLWFSLLDYQKSVQAMEILALISGVAAIGVWVVYICSSAMSERATHVVKIVAIVLVALTGG